MIEALMDGLVYRVRVGVEHSVADNVIGIVTCLNS